MMKINRTNWKEFCEEPKLTEAEHATWTEMARLITDGKDGLFVFVIDATETEFTEAFAEFAIADDWSDMAKRADSYRRLRRAEIKAYQQWKEMQNAEE